MDKTTQTAIIIFAAVIAFSFLVQAVVMISLLIASRKTQKKIHALTEDLRLHVLPAVSASRALVEDLSPKLKVIVANFVDTSHKIRTISTNVEGAVGDVTDRARAQAAHVDDMMEGALNQISHAGQTLQHGISVPVRQFNGIVNGLKAGLDVLCRKDHSRNGSSIDEDLFV